MSEQLEVSATWLEEMHAQVSARGHKLEIGEPSSGDHGMMPTEAFLGGLASCYCLALAFAAAKRGRTLPGLQVTARTQRVGRELRYGDVEIEARAEVPGDELEALGARARRLCWVSNMLAEGVEVSYRFTSVDKRFQR